ncbi:MAG: ankyrin repeat domain-containing protein [Puniceicoccales bacterium]|jgi:hypothetical protein|nr:ankyrin repeat domain-containing protein [Puniceicoccales bacterium]
MFNIDYAGAKLGVTQGVTYQILAKAKNRQTEKLAWYTKLRLSIFGITKNEENIIHHAITKSEIDCKDMKLRSVENSSREKWGEIKAKMNPHSITDQSTSIDGKKNITPAGLTQLINAMKAQKTQQLQKLIWDQYPNSQENQQPTPEKIKKYSQQIRELIEAGADVNAKNGDCDDTPLSYAVRSRSPEVVEALLSAKDIKVNAQDHLGYTALHRVAMRSDQDGESIVKILLKCPGIDLDVRDKYNNRSIDCASHSSNSYNILFDEYFDKGKI